MKGQTFNSFLARQAKSNTQTIINAQKDRIRELERKVAGLVKAGEQILGASHFTVLDATAPYKDFKQAIKQAKGEES